MMEAGGWSTAALRDGRYDGVVHLVTAADGAAAAYGCATNASRVETPAQAVTLDAKLRSCWVGHPALRVVDNAGGGGFAAKMERVYGVVCGMVGVPASATCRRKFLVLREGGVALSAMAGVADFEVVQTFLVTPPAGAVGAAAAAAAAGDPVDGGDGDAGSVRGTGAPAGGAWQESVRQRGRDGYYTFVHKVRRPVAARAGPDGWEELKRAVGNRDYLSLLARADPSRRSVRIRRRCFLYRRSYYVLDAIEQPDGQAPLLLLRTHVEAAGEPLELPPWLHIGREVTGEPPYTVYELSRRLGRERRLFAGRPFKGLGTGRSRVDLLDLGTSV
ncbi:hypothetical protein BU14_0260s0002 [Porphyra umbilicalis]|uniref:Uncharacterized protein n=1 Tax=Porphyra umbilicalis TaxID=2786 RepID=A0A1X6P2R1_PORUM|nr:hypothetical protein BU14_0260s0002 [Porphyra umbilicalis]|eukprot:OSX74933.1 hypothetical protein BU14_0260s0002 [Porphyra umbilicalis]